jgi:carbon-monoxide dehydrogenase medium subunit
MYDFHYHRPGSLAEASALIADCRDGVYLAGGQTLIATLKQRLARPSDVVDLGAIDGLAGIAHRGDVIEVGAMTLHADVAASGDVRKAIPALGALAAMIGDPQVRNRGTIGGSLATNDPAADYPAAVLALAATIHTDRRDIAADDFFRDLFETALAPGEIITKVSFPLPERAGYAKFPNPASRYAMVGVMVGVMAADLGGGVRVAVTGAGACVFRQPDMEAALSKSFTAAAIEAIVVSDEDFNDDIHGSAEYRAHLVTVMAKRAVDAADCGPRP